MSNLLFKPYPLTHQTLKNRIVVAPMCQYSAVDGYAQDWHFVHYGQYALGGAAAIIQEATAISPEGRITHGDLGLWEDGQIEKLKQITSFIKNHGAIPGIQLAHSGRKGSCNKPWISRAQFKPNEENGWQTIGPSANGFHPSDNPATAMSLDEINRIKQAFVDTTKRAIEAGYEIIEVHAAHGYLLHQFLSPLINERTDEYGGSFENRIRLTLEVVQAIKDVLTTQSLWLRISATDWAEGGWDLEQSIALSQKLKAIGVEVMDVSSGGSVREQEIDIKPGYQVPFAERIKKETGLTTGAVGIITQAQQAEDILQNGQADLILLARKMLQNPYFPLHAAMELGIDIPWQNQYERGKETY